MIELRWLIKRIPRPTGIDDGMYSPPLPKTIDIPTLQYREWPPGLKPSTCVDGSLEPNWIDVPAVEAPR